MAANGLIWLSTERSTFGLIVRDGVVAEAPPIARRWWLGREAREVWREASRRGMGRAWIPDEVTT